MTGSRLVVTIAFLAGSAVSALLWRFWTPRCNEACSEWVALSMIGFVVAFPLACLGASVAISAKRHAMRTRWALPAFFMLGSVVLIAMLTDAAK